MTRSTHALLLALLLAACDANDRDRPRGQAGGAATPQARLSVVAVDAPPRFDALSEVRVRIERLEAIGRVTSATGAGGDDVTASLLDEPRELELLRLRGGVTEALASADVPPGVYSALRLTLSRVDVSLDGTAFATDDGDLTLVGEETVVPLREPVLVDAGETAELLLDFDLARSLDVVGDPPTSLTFTTTVHASRRGPGTLRGVITSDAGTPGVFIDDVPLAGAIVTASDDGIVLGSTTTDAQGVFALEGGDGDVQLLVEAPDHATVTLTGGVGIPIDARLTRTSPAVD
jgi:hypothetical protein